MALLVTLFLVLVNIFNTVTTNTPKAEGLTAIEAWMLACILFVFGALTEYAGILFRYVVHCSVYSAFIILFLNEQFQRDSLRGTARETGRPVHGGQNSAWAACTFGRIVFVSGDVSLLYSALGLWVPSASKEKVLGRNRREIRCSHTMIDTTCGSWEWRRCISQQ